MRYTVNYGSAKEPDLVEMTLVGPHEAVRSDMIASLSLREWIEAKPSLMSRKPRKRAA